MSETATELRLDRLEADVRDMRVTLGRLEPLIIRIDERLNATLPHLATKAELATAVTSLTTALGDKPGKTFLVGSIGVLLAAYALGLAGVAALPVLRGLIH
ncbi:MAG TPA: hypothetical protein VGI78_19120 [Acetobacteraceae bacterium]